MKFLCPRCRKKQDWATQEVSGRRFKTELVCGHIIYEPISERLKRRPGRS